MRLWATICLPARCTMLLRRVSVVWRCERRTSMPSAGSVEELKRIVEKIRSAWPLVLVWWCGRGLRIFREELMAWCEANPRRVLAGLAKNER